MKETELIKLLNIDENSEDVSDAICLSFGYGKGKIVAESAGNYFVRCDGDDDTKEYIIGMSIVELEDGTPTAIPDTDDNKIKAAIEKKLGAKVLQKLKTYVQYVSNDNY